MRFAANINKFINKRDNVLHSANVFATIAVLYDVKWILCWLLCAHIVEYLMLQWEHPIRSFIYRDSFKTNSNLEHRFQCDSPVCTLTAIFNFQTALDLMTINDWRLYILEWHENRQTCSAWNRFADEKWIAWNLKIQVGKMVTLEQSHKCSLLSSCNFPI